MINPFTQVDYSKIRDINTTLFEIEINSSELCNRTCSFCPKSDPLLAPDTYQKMDLILVDKLCKDLKKMNFELVEVGNFTGYAFNKVLFSQVSNFFLLIEHENIKKEKILKIFKKINNNLDVLHTLDLIGIDVSLNILENLKEEYNYYVPEILYLCKSKKIYGKKNKTSIKSIFESPNYPKVKNDKSSK